MNAVHSGIDSFHALAGVDGNAYPTAIANQYFQRFDLAKQRMALKPEPQFFGFVAFMGAPFQLLPHGKKTYAYVLTNPDIGDIRIMRGESWNGKAAKNQGYLMFQFRNEYILKVGVRGCLNAIADLLDELTEGGRPRLWVRVSKLDICVDIESESGFGWEDLDKFVSRSRDLSPFQEKSDSLNKTDIGAVSEIDSLDEGTKDNQPSPNVQPRTPPAPVPEIERTHWNRAKRRLETVYFGSTKRPLYARIYNKRLQAEKCGKSQWEPIWKANGARPDTQIWRFEFSLKGEILRQFPADGGGNLQDAFKLIWNLDKLWNYLTKKWLAQVIKRSRGEKRPPVFTELWQAVIDGFGDVLAAVRSPERKPEVKPLRKQAKGCILTAIALLGGDDPRERFLQEMERLFNWVESPEFLEKYRLRRLLLGKDHCNFVSNQLREVYQSA